VTGRNRQFFIVPERVDVNSANDTIINSVIAWSFYPKLMTRENKTWRNVANNQNVSLQGTSVNKRADPSIQWLSYYHIMQSRNRSYNAHETSAVESFAVALLCGDLEFKVRTRSSCFAYALTKRCRFTPASYRSTITACVSQSATGSRCSHSKDSALACVRLWRT
jgi:hypothetical protein